jgi:hypothetical protein
MTVHCLPGFLSFAASTIMKVAYGKIAPTSASDEEAKYVRQRFVALSKAMRPGAYLVDLIPWLKYLPWYGRDLRNEFETVSRFYIAQLNIVKQQIVRIALKTFTSCLNHSTDEQGEHRPFFREIYFRK